MRKGIMITILVVALLGIGGWWVWIRSAHGFSANAKPTWIETELATLSRKLALGRQDDVKNPYPATPARLAAAHQLFHDQCALCHNDNGDGHTKIGQALYPKTPDLRGLTQNKSDGELFFSIRNGIRLSGMPAWSSQDSDEQIWDLVSLIRTMKLHPQP
jgi:mono/diheme cytochrome c family protein